MRVLLQRVSRAAVRVGEDSASRVVGRIGSGLVLLVGFRSGDEATASDVLPWMADKVIGLRVFNDDAQKMNRALAEVGGAVLVVSQFTLYGDVRTGRRPSFIEAARPDVARVLYDRFVEVLRARAAEEPTGVTVETGEFGAMMDVELVNEGPVTLLLER